jgi:predicted nucleic acid-binding OB-fold protein
MEAGSLIDNYLELLPFDENYNIYISRKSLKHFVESRKKEMFNSHTEVEIFNKLFFAIDNVICTYISYDEMMQKDSNRMIYVKYFENIKLVNLRIVLESVSDRLEICSIHFQKHK